MQIEYSIKYSHRKTLSIIVDRDSSVVVRAPFDTSKELIEKEVNKRKYLLFQKIHHPQKYENPKPRKELVTGESLLLLGQHYPLELSESPIDGVAFDNKFIISSGQKAAADKILKHWYITQAKEKIIPKVKLHATNLGVKYAKIKILDLKYRWGSCSPKDNISFNWKLIKAPMHVIEYIIVHELAHLIEPNHSPEFWNIVSIQLPHYEKAKDWLKENGHLLELAF